MSMYDIQRWDVVLTSTRMQAPAIYLNPTGPLLDYIRLNNFTIPVKITGTMSAYDNILVMATCQPSQNTAGYRPNFQAATNTIVLVLDMRWDGYPNNLGNVYIDVVPESTETALEHFLKNTEPHFIPCLLVSISFILFLLLFECKMEKKKYM